MSLVQFVSYLSIGHAFIPVECGQFILDLADRKVVGWALSDSLKAVDTSVAAWRMALINRAIDGRLIFHSDRDIQYACTEFRDELKDLPVEQSMTGLPEQSKRKLSLRRSDGITRLPRVFSRPSKVSWSTILILRREQRLDWLPLSVSRADGPPLRYNCRRKHSVLNYRTPSQQESYFYMSAMAA